jgi:hypothetical protein
MTGYFRARGSLLAYQKALTGTGRTSQMGLQLEMPNLPEPYVGATVADKRMKAFQENIDVASKGLVRFPWLDSPDKVRSGIETPQGGGAAAAGLPSGLPDVKTGNSGKPIPEGAEWQVGGKPVARVKGGAWVAP